MRVRGVVIAKTYPEISRKYGPLVCTVILTEDYQWMRLYPIPFRLFLSDKGFHKWDVIEVDVEKATHDPRRESYKVLNPEGIRVVEHIDDWRTRVNLVRKVLDNSIEEIIESGRSIGVVRPVRILDFFAKPRERLRDEAEREVLQKMDEAQATLLEYIGKPELRNELLSDVLSTDVKIEEIPWIGYRFYCSRECKGHEMMVIDWEVQELFRKYRTIEPVKKKVFIEFLNERDLYFVVGNTWRFHKSFMIISIIYPPKNTQPTRGLDEFLK